MAQCDRLYGAVNISGPAKACFLAFRVPLGASGTTGRLRVLAKGRGLHALRTLAGSD